jgi:hypothetical protein
VSACPSLSLFVSGSLSLCVCVCMSLSVLRVYVSGVYVSGMYVCERVSPYATLSCSERTCVVREREREREKGAMRTNESRNGDGAPDGPQVANCIADGKYNFGTELERDRG